MEEAIAAAERHYQTYHYSSISVHSSGIEPLMSSDIAVPHLQQTTLVSNRHARNPFDATISAGVATAETMPAALPEPSGLMLSYVQLMLMTACLR